MPIAAIPTIFPTPTRGLPSIISISATKRSRRIITNALSIPMQRLRAKINCRLPKRSLPIAATASVSSILADFREELAKSGAALRAGDPEGAIGLLSEIPKGCGEYSAAQELLAVAMLLKGDAEGAEETCLALLKENANDVQALATLSALYSEEEKRKPRNRGSALLAAGHHGGRKI